MVKWFCDRCGKETLDNKVSQRLMAIIPNPKSSNPTNGTITIEIMLAVNGVYNSGVICKNCLLEMLKELK